MINRKPLVILVISAILGFLINPFAYSEEISPQRIISLGPALTEELYILGAEDRLVGCTVYCRRPPEASDKEKVGTALEINLERVVSLKPDLVLATSLTNPEAKAKLANLEIKVITFPEARSFSQICEHFLELGRIVGKEKEAVGIIGIAKDKVDSIKKRTQNLQRPKVFIQIGTRPLVTAIGDSFINDFIEFAGGINISQDSKNIRYSREKVFMDDPDIIIIVTMGIDGEGEKKIWQRFETLTAAKDNRIYIIEPDKITSPTPVIFADTLEEIAGILHPVPEEER